MTPRIVTVCAVCAVRASLLIREWLPIVAMHKRENGRNACGRSRAVLKTENWTLTPEHFGIIGVLLKDVIVFRCHRGTSAVREHLLVSSPPHDCGAPSWLTPLKDVENFLLIVLCSAALMCYA